MTRTFCPQCKMETTGWETCHWCEDTGPPPMYDGWRQLVSRNAVCLSINIALVLSILLVWAMVVRGQERVEYYTLDDGTRVPIVNGEISVRHERRVIADVMPSPDRFQRKSSQTVPMNREAREYRPGVRQAPFLNSTRTISARVAAKANLSLTDGYPTASTSIGVRVAGSRGDTKP